MQPVPRFDRVVVLGARGQLGSALVAQEWPLGISVLPATRDQVDLTDPIAVHDYIHEWRPQVVVNAAGFTAADRAEEEPEAAIDTNHRAVGYLVDALRSTGGRLVQVSTADVFDGATAGWYTEHDQVNPLSVYARSMRRGEVAALQLENSLVVRSSWLYSSGGENFVRTIHRLGQTRASLDVVDDLLGCPTSVDELAGAIVTAIGAGLPYTGVFHIASPDHATWWEVADEVLRFSGRRADVKLNRLRAAECRPRARRPIDSRISSDAFATAYGVTLSPWRQALQAVLKQLELTSIG
ncbi:MAG: dTDP-4-dehydrorhamnose reductase [Acidimicrobiales bacterium]